MRAAEQGHGAQCSAGAGDAASMEQMLQQWLQDYVMFKQHLAHAGKARTDTAMPATAGPKIELS